MTALAFPQINQQTIMINATTIDEWYGIKIKFSWEDAPLTQDQLEACLRAEVGGVQHAQGWDLVCHVFQVVRRSTAWKDFYAIPQHITCDENGSNAAQREVVLPQFDDPNDCSDWHFDSQGGQIALDTR